MSILLLILLLAYQIYDSVSTAKETQKYKSVMITEKERIRYYRSCILWGWVPVVIIYIFSFFSKVTPANIGLRAVAFSEYTWLNAVTLAIGGFFAFSFVYSVIMYFASEKYREKAAVTIESRWIFRQRLF